MKFNDNTAAVVRQTCVVAATYVFVTGTDLETHMRGSEGKGTEVSRRERRLRVFIRITLVRAFNSRFFLATKRRADSRTCLHKYEEII